MANVSKSISIPNEEFSDDTTPSVARKFLNKVKSTIVTLQRVVKQKITLDIHNWSSSAQQEIHKIVKDEIFPIVNQVDVRVQNFKIQFLKEAAKFVRDFKSLTKEADESLAKHKTLESEIESLLRVVVNQDIMSIVQNPTVVELSDLQSELEYTLDPLSQKLENENVELEYQVLNYAKENAHLKTIYKNLFESIKVTRAQTKAITDSLQDKLQDTIYENAKLRAQLFDKVSEQMDTTKGLPKINESHALSKPITSNSAPPSRESNVMNNEKVIAPGIFRINPFKASGVNNFVSNKHVKASVKTKPVTVSQPYVISTEDVNSITRGFSPKDIDSTTRTRRPQSRNNPKNARVPSKSKSSCVSNKLEKIEENHRSLQPFNYPDHTSSECNNIKLAIRNEKYEVYETPKAEYMYPSTCCPLSSSKDGLCTLQCITRASDKRGVQNRRDLPRNTPLDRVKVLGMIEKRSKVRMGIMWTKTELALEQSQQGVSYEVSCNKFWCTAIAYDPEPPENNSEARPLKEYLIKLSVMNGKKPLILDYKTFVESIGLDNAKGKYVSHPSTEEVKAELAKIIDNPILLDRTPVLKTAFPVA
ncbi:hypothetical protein Tco_0615225 [Tanacetum coccineum]